MKQDKNEKAMRRHKAFFAVGVRLVTLPFRWIFKCTADKACRHIEGPYLVLSNHNTDLDPVLVGIALRKHLYFVASEHIFRKGWLSKILVYLIDPIPRTKGSVESAAAMAIIRRLRKGNSVGVFAEGNRSFNGVTTRVHPATAKLVRSAGVKLVTLRMEGGYLTTPRWGKGIRRGGMHISLAGVYEAEDIKKMSVEEIDALICRDLYEDAYQRQAQNNYSYNCKNRAHYMETALFMCPACGGIGTMQSGKHDLICGCGMKVTFTKQGYLEGDAPFNTVTAWDVWQREALEKQFREAGEDALLFADEGAALCRYDGNHQETERVEGVLRLYPDRLEVGERVMPFADISALSIYGRNHMVFTFAGEHFEIHGGARFSALKYLYAYEIATDTASLQTVQPV